jgi:hypothetical protein
VHYTEAAIRQSLTDRIASMYGREAILQSLQNVASDLIGVTDPADLPADCRAWVEGAINDVAARTAQAATDQLLTELAVRFAAAPDDLEGCQLMQAVSRAQAIHVTEVR